LIGGIDSGVNAKLKARASERGLKIGEALTESIKTCNTPEKNDWEWEWDLNIAIFRRMRRFLEKNTEANGFS